MPFLPWAISRKRWRGRGRRAARDVRSAGISEVVEQERILELPLQGRNVTDLIVLAGARGVDGQRRPKSIPGSHRDRRRGGLPIGVAYTRTGDAQQPVRHYNMPLPVSRRAAGIQRGDERPLRAERHARGRLGQRGDQIGHQHAARQPVRFVRDKRFNATAAFAPAGPDGKKLNDGLVRHQPGGTVGGPIVQDRLFFFGGYQGTFVRVNPPAVQSRVPTAAMLAGDFTAFASPACNAGRQITLRAPFVNNRISPALFSPAAMNVAKQLPSSTDPCGEIRFSAPESYDQGQIVTKVDYQAGANHSIFGRYIITLSDKEPAWPGSGNVLTTRPADTAQKHRAHSLTLGDTKVFGANTVNSFRVAWGTAVRRLSPRAVLSVRSRLASEISTLRSRDHGHHRHGRVHDGEWRFGVGSSTPTPTRWATTHPGQGQPPDDTGRRRGVLAVGLARRPAGGGVWQFNGSATGLGLSDFLTGNVFSMGQARAGVLTMSQWQRRHLRADTWARRTASRSTVASLGTIPRAERPQHAIYNFSRENYQQRIRSTVFHTRRRPRLSR